MASTISPNMSLIVPTVGQQPGPEWASDLNASLTIIDQHTHAPGSGVPITPAALNINTDLTVNSHFITDLAGLVLVAQLSTPAINTVYQSGVDLYFVDGNGNNVRITQSGGIAGSPGSISNLTSPASASYVSGSSTFVWQSDTNIAANMDAGSLILRNLSPNSTFGLTLAPPDALSLNYTLTLPSLPLATTFMTLSATGAIAGGPNLSGGLTTTNLSASAGITGGQISSSAALSVASVVASGAISAASLSAPSITASSGTVTAQTLVITAGATVGTTLAVTGSLTVATKNAVVSNTNAASALAVIRAGISSAGGVGVGEGLSSAVRFATGSYTLTFSTAFASTPTVVAACNNTAPHFCVSAGTLTSAVNIFVYDSVTGALVDDSFDVIITGPRT